MQNDISSDAMLAISMASIAIRDGDFKRFERLHEITICALVLSHGVDFHRDEPLNCQSARKTAPLLE